jgi:hypothetical protein
MKKPGPDPIMAQTHNLWAERQIPLPLGHCSTENGNFGNVYNIIIVR